MHHYVVGTAVLKHHRLGFFRRSRLRNCGVLDVKPDPTRDVQGVLYRLPWPFSDRLDEREEGYHQVAVTVRCGDQLYPQTRTYTVMDKVNYEIAPNDWYASVVLRGALTCGLPDDYRWSLFHHIHDLQQREQLWQRSSA